MLVPMDAHHDLASDLFRQTHLSFHGIVEGVAGDGHNIAGAHEVHALRIHEQDESYVQIAATLGAQRQHGIKHLVARLQKLLFSKRRLKRLVGIGDTLPFRFKTGYIQKTRC